MAKKRREAYVEDVGRDLEDPVLPVLDEIVVVEVLDEEARVESGFGGYRFENLGRLPKGPWSTENLRLGRLRVHPPEPRARTQSTPVEDRGPRQEEVEVIVLGKGKDPRARAAVAVQRSRGIGLWSARADASAGLGYIPTCRGRPRAPAPEGQVRLLGARSGPRRPRPRIRSQPGSAAVRPGHRVDAVLKGLRPWLAVRRVGYISWVRSESGDEGAAFRVARSIRRCSGAADEHWLKAQCKTLEVAGNPVQRGV